MSEPFNLPIEFSDCLYRIGGEHLSRYLGVLSEFPIFFKNKDTRYSQALGEIKTVDELRELMAVTLEGAKAYSLAESERFLNADDAGAAQFMQSFAKWSHRYFRDMAQEVNMLIPEAHHISVTALGVTREDERSAKEVFDKQNRDFMQR